MVLQQWGKVPAEDTTRCHHLIKGRSQDFQRKGWKETAQIEPPPLRASKEYMAKSTEGKLQGSVKHSRDPEATTPSNSKSNGNKQDSSRTQ